MAATDGSSDGGITVVTPAYNSAEFIAEAIDSVLAQDHPVLEMIVVDDGSTDDTRAVVEAYAGRGVRLLTQANQGSAAARNLGIEHARGRWIAFLDADDVWWSKKLSTQMRALASTNHGLAYSRFLRWQPDSEGCYPDAESLFAQRPAEALSDGALVTGWPYAELLLDCIVWTSTVVVQKAALDRAGRFDHALRKGQDYDLWLRLARDVSMIGVDEPCALYRRHGGGITEAVKPVNYEYTILSRTVERWGETGPDGRRPAPGLVKSRLARSALNHGLAHLRRGSARIALQSFGQSIHHGGLNPKLALCWTAALLRCAVARRPQP
jgi:glycosyltransferase involved in cell wall biosynthesis